MFEQVVSTIHTRNKLALDDIAYLIRYEGLFHWATYSGELVCSEQLTNYACSIGCIEYILWMEHGYDLLDLDLRRGFIAAARNGHYRIVRYLAHTLEDEPKRMTDEMFDDAIDDAFYGSTELGHTDVTEYLCAEFETRVSTIGRDIIAELMEQI
jgi:hypothetical protein